MAGDVFVQGFERGSSSPSGTCKLTSPHAGCRAVTCACRSRDRGLGYPFALRARDPARFVGAADAPAPPTSTYRRLHRRLTVPFLLHLTTSQAPILRLHLSWSAYLPLSPHNHNFPSHTAHHGRRRARLPPGYQPLPEVCGHDPYVITCAQHVTNLSSDPQSNNVFLEQSAATRPSARSSTSPASLLGTSTAPTTRNRPSMSSMASRRTSAACARPCA